MEARVTSDYRNYCGILTTNIMVVESREGRWRQHYFIYSFLRQSKCLSAALSEAQQRMKVMWAEIL